MSEGELSQAEARRIALSAQGFGRARPADGVDQGHLRRLVYALGAVQIDAVNVLIRSHYLPAYSRLGRYAVELFDRLVYEKREAFEYWGHAASFLPVELHPALRWRMARHASDKNWIAVQARIERERPGYLTAVEREISERGPLAYGDLTDSAPRERTQTRYAESSLLWYRWSDGKTALEGLFSAGRLAVAGRRGFQRLFDLTGRVIPADILEAPTPSDDDAQRQLVLHAMTALGVATVRDVADYFRLPVVATRSRLRELASHGAVDVVRVQGWGEDAYLLPEASSAPLGARALLSPFDSLIWDRARTERVFGFRHTFELYVKAEKRQYGYYVLPFLLGDGLVARVDLKADRDGGKLSVLGAFAETGTSVGDVTGELAVALRDLAAWLNLDSVDVVDRGDLAPQLRRALMSVA